MKAEKKKTKKTLDELFAAALEDAPTVKGYTIKQVAEKIDAPWPSYLPFPPVVEYFDVGKVKVYQLKRKVIIHERI
jgi:hypothetical protein